MYPTVYHGSVDQGHSINGRKIVEKEKHDYLLALDIFLTNPRLPRVGPLLTNTCIYSPVKSHPPMQLPPVPPKVLVGLDPE